MAQLSAGSGGHRNPIPFFPPLSSQQSCSAPLVHFHAALDTGNGIIHSKEPRYPYHPRLNPGAGKRADWKIGEKLVEYFGLAGNAEYDQRTMEKIELAREERIQLVAIYPEDLFDLEGLLMDNEVHDVSRAE